jgi:hypothetical protein
MKFGSITTGIIADGLIFNMDPANRACYPKTGTTATDTVGNITGTLTNGTAFSDTNEGIFDFDGSDDYITLGTPTYLKITGDISISAWIKTTSSNAMTTININDKWGLYFSGGSKIRFNFRNPSDDFKYVESATVINDGNWHHVMGVNDQTNLKLYVDGVLDASNADGSAGTTGTSDTRIGSRFNNSLYFDGNIASIQIYHQALSANEVLHNYNALKNRFV